ncbi:MAG: ABC transporter permease [Treponema sp.]|jgi:simple sugar transport system permease protein|nr:ABC transporter permease [Treponema sp.]
MKKRSSVYADLIFGALIPLGAALLIPFLFILIGSARPGKTLVLFFTGPWSSLWFAGNTLDGMALLLSASLGALIAFRGGCFNLGGEGQIYLGGCAAAAVLLIPCHVPGPVMLFLAALASAAAGGAMGAVCGFLRKQLGAGELISSFLLAAALIPLGNYLISSVLRDPRGNLLATEKFPPNRLLPKLLPPSTLSVSLIIALALVVCFYVFIHRTAPGYRFRIAGAAPDLALFGGIDAEKRFFPAMALSGSLSGLTGFFAAAGTYGMCYQDFSGGIGWNAIAMALIAGNEPLLLIPVVFLFTALKAGSDAAILQASFGFETAAFIQAAALFLAALPFGIRYLERRRR